MFKISDIGGNKKMSYFEDDYFEDQSEADQIMDEAVDKLVGLISENTKAEIEKYKKLYESSAKRVNELRKESYEQAEKIKVLEIDLKRTKEELERQDNEIPKIPFMPGEKVWWIGNDCAKTVRLECSTCSGSGKVKTQTADYGEVEITCPNCKGKKFTNYEPAKAYSGYVVESHVTLDAVDDVPSFVYRLVEDERDLENFKNGQERYTFTRYEIYKTKEEAEKVANQETEIRKIKAEEDLHPTK